MSINNKKMRRLSTAMITAALAITLTSCSGATNKYGNLEKNSVYASIGDYKITNEDLWNEFQWSAIDVLNDQKTTVLVNEQIERITNVINTNGDYSKLENKKVYHNSQDEISEDDFNDLYKTYKNRLIDYVVADIYKCSFIMESYWKKVDDYDDITKAKYEKQYIDKIYSTYQKSSIADGDDKGKTYEDVIKTISEDTPNGAFSIAKDLSELYYRQYAKELYTYDVFLDESDEAITDDTDETDDKYGKYTYAEIVNKFKEEYTNTFDLNLIKINFTSSTEFTDTLRAFGMYINNNSFYFIYDDETDHSKKTDYSQYVDHYKEFVGTSSNLKGNGAEKISGRVMLEIYIMLYNYMYGGYLDMLPSASGVDIDYSDLNTLRDQTLKLINKYKVSDEETLYNSTVDALKQFDAAKAENEKVLTFSKEKLEDSYSSSFATYCYETLKLVDDNNYDDYNSRYSTAIQNEDSSYLIIYKFDDTLDDMTDEAAKSYEEYYLDKNHTTLDYYDFLRKDENKQLFEDVLDALIWSAINESIITNKVTAGLEDIEVKVYTEATEIAYAKDNENYSKSVGSAKNSNVLASMKYDDKTYYLNIKADDNDKESIMIPGTSTAFGVFDYLEKTKGVTTAIDLLSKKMIKDTKQYEEVKNDKENKDIYNTYIQNVLLNFANDGYSSSGYPSSIGKYNFLMLYFHTANVNEIIDNYYMIQLASAKLLTDYSNSSLSSFFELYTNYAYDKYFSLSGKRLVVYMDADEDGKYDDTADWIDTTVENWTDYNGNVITTTKEYVAKQLAYTIYNKMSASANSSHATRVEELVSEINGSAKAEYNDNPVAAENVWAKYKKLGLNVALEDVSATNSTTAIDYNIKQRLYDYARGYNEDGSITYQYYINETTPTEYIEPLTEAAISTDNDAIITSNDGINLLIVTTGTANASAKWSEEDNSDTLLKNIILKYNEKYVAIKDVFNNDKKLSSNQIQLYILDNAVNGSSTLSPASISDALTTFLSPVYTRYTSSETQRIILLYFMRNYINSSNNIFNIINYSNESYNGDNGFFKKLILINQDIADNYNSLENDTTGTSNLYPDWWEKLEEQVKNFLIDLKEEAK